MAEKPIKQNLNQSTQLAVILIVVLALVAIVPSNYSVSVLLILTLLLNIIYFNISNYFGFILTGSFLFRMGIILGNSHLRFLPKPPIIDNHNQRAIALASQWGSGNIFNNIHEIPSMRGFMSHILAPFYLLFGDSIISGQIGIAIISLLIGYLVYILGREVTTNEKSLLAVFIVMFWPTIVYRSVILQREVVMIVSLLTFLWVAIQWLDSIEIQTIVLAILSLTVVFFLREENLFILITVLFSLGVFKARESVKYMFSITVSSCIFLAYFVLEFNKFTGHGSSISPAALDSYAHARAHGEAAYLTDIHYETWLDVIIYLPVKLVYFLYTPFPWQVQGLTEAIVGISAIGLLIMTLPLLRGVKGLMSDNGRLVLLITFLATGVVTYSIIEMNYGSAVRRKIQFIPILLLISMVGMPKIKLQVDDT